MAGIEVVPPLKCMEGVCEVVGVASMLVAVTRGRMSARNLSLLFVGCCIVGWVVGCWQRALIWGATCLMLHCLEHIHGSLAIRAMVKIPLLATWYFHGRSPQVAFALSALYATEGDMLVCLGLWTSLVCPMWRSGTILPITALLIDGFPSLFRHLAITYLTPRKQGIIMRYANAFSVLILTVVSVTHAVITPSGPSFILGLALLFSHIHSLFLNSKNLNRQPSVISE
eukprot:TRINITY_DN2342_c0_g1_i1.p1 TRINITY_DN2342_c0_g1~~TRINITY_DN2342_c0_g1_i1.p1  ORF type:complete len:227 (+),score=19.08 TRINITY_DN2342_c0_g1_i1:42-722(+)